MYESGRKRQDLCRSRSEGNGSGYAHSALRMSDIAKTKNKLTLFKKGKEGKKKLSI